MRRTRQNNIPSALIPIIAINVIVFLVQIVTQALDIPFTQTFALSMGDLFSAPYTLLTSMFMHASLFHIFINMFILFMFGGLLEQRIGTKRFLIVYFTAGLLAAVASNFIYPMALGASGAVMGVVGVVIMLMPNLKVLFFFFIPMPLWIAGILIAFIEIIGAFGTGGNVANVAHLVGMATGLIYGYKLKKDKKRFNRRFQKTLHLNGDDVDDYLRRGRL